MGVIAVPRGVTFEAGAHRRHATFAQVAFYSVAVGEGG